MMTACESEIDYQAGEPTPEGCMGVYFDSSNQSDYILTPEDSCITITLSRAVSDEAASVPIVVGSKTSSCMLVPATADFEAGESTTSFDVTFPDIEQTVTQQLSISISEDYADHYAKVDGSTTFEASVLVAQWVLVTDSATFNFQSKYDPIVSKLYQLEGQRIFYVENFLNSGYDFRYRVGSDVLDSYGDYEFIPMDLGYPITDSSDGSIIVHLWDYEHVNESGSTGAYMTWYPQEGVAGIDHCYIYNYYPSTWYSYVQPYTSSKTGLPRVYTLMYFWIYYTDGTSGWNYCTMDYQGSLPD